MARSSFATQANALFLKNITFQKRNLKENIRLILFPVFLCLMLMSLKIISRYLNGISSSASNLPQKQSIFVVSDDVLTPKKKPAMLQIPLPEFRAVRNEFIPYEDWPDESCRAEGTCPVTILVTGQDESLGKSVVTSLFTTSASMDFSPRRGGSLNSSDETPLVDTNDLLLGSTEGLHIRDDYHQVVQAQCKHKAKIPIIVKTGFDNYSIVAQCAQGLGLWRNSSLQVNDELFKGYAQGNSKNEVNEILAAYDFLNSDKTNFNVNVWYNSTDDLEFKELVRTVNMASNAYLKFLNGTAARFCGRYAQATIC